MNARSGSTTVGPDTTRIAPTWKATPLLMPARSKPRVTATPAQVTTTPTTTRAHDHTVRAERELAEREPQPRFEQDDADGEDTKGW